MIKIKNFNAYHGRKQLLHDINLTISKGESIVIIGESGAGKTVLSKVLIGHVPKSIRCTGEVFYRDEAIDLRNQSLREHHISYVVQNPMSMFNDFQTIQKHFDENIKSVTKMSALERHEAIYSVLQKVGLHKDVLKKYPFQLSGGMLQRIMFALTNVIDSDTYILDEPTSALDKDNTQKVCGIINEFRENGKTILTITHDYKFAENIADRIIMLKKGHIIADGSLDEILTSSDKDVIQLLQNPFKRLVKTDA